jgi:hypothetical protein
MQEKPTVAQMLRMPEGNIQVDVPVESAEYQKFLDANRLREQSREEFGYITPEAQEKYQEAVKAVSELALRTYQTSRSS